MNFRPAISCLAALSISLLPAAAYAQSVNVTRSILQDQPYTIIYPDFMIPSGGASEPLSLTHPSVPLQCDITIVPVEDTTWSADSALANLDDGEVAASWAKTFPGFTLNSKSTTPYQSGAALLYDGQSTDSPMGIPLTIVHTETVDSGRGYTLDCLFATEVTQQARPIVDFIIANFSTRSDAECCVGAEAAPVATETPAPTQ